MTEQTYTEQDLLDAYRRGIVDGELKGMLSTLKDSLGVFKMLKRHVKNVAGNEIILGECIAGFEGLLRRHGNGE